MTESIYREKENNKYVTVPGKKGQFIPREVVKASIEFELIGAHSFCFFRKRLVNWKYETVAQY